MARTSQVGSNKETIVDSRRKVAAIIKFKPPTFILPSPKDSVPPKNNHLDFFFKQPNVIFFPSQKETIFTFQNKPYWFGEMKKNPFLFGRRKYFLLFRFIFLLLPSRRSPPLELSPPTLLLLSPAMKSLLTPVPLLKSEKPMIVVVVLLPSENLLLSLKILPL